MSSSEVELELCIAGVISEGEPGEVVNASAVDPLLVVDIELNTDGAATVLDTVSVTTEGAPRSSEIVTGSAVIVVTNAGELLDGVSVTVCRIEIVVVITVVTVDVV